MLLDSIEHIGYRIAGLAAVIYAAEKTNILKSILSGGDSDVLAAVKASALLSGSEFLSDHLLSITLNTRVPSLYRTISQFGVAFITNALVIYAFEKTDLDSVIIKPNSSEEMRALEFAIFFVIVQEISYKLIQMYMGQFQRIGY